MRASTSANAGFTATLFVRWIGGTSSMYARRVVRPSVEKKNAPDTLTPTDMDEWIVVVDGDPVSREQLQVCHALKPALRGAVRCDDRDNGDAPVCHTVTHFPAFCHVPSNACVYGLRATATELDALPTLAPP